MGVKRAAGKPQHAGMGVKRTAGKPQHAGGSEKEGEERKHGMLANETNKTRSQEREGRETVKSEKSKLLL